MTTTNLTDALAALGIRHEPAKADPQRRALYDATGTHLGDFDAVEGWALVQRRLQERAQL